VPQLGHPTRCATWSNLEGILASESTAGLAGAVGQGITRQLVAALLPEECRLMEGMANGESPG
jgi:hypothetical protein